MVCMASGFAEYVVLMCKALINFALIALLSTECANIYVVSDMCTFNYHIYSIFYFDVGIEIRIKQNIVMHTLIEHTPVDKIS